MILIEDVLILHEKSIQDFGGAFGIRDINLLESAIARPFQTFEGDYLYPDELNKVAALGESLITNHPFIDGNKRTGLLAMITLLIEYKLKLNATKEETYQLIIDISTGLLKFDDIVLWLKENTKSL